MRMPQPRTTKKSISGSAHTSTSRTTHCSARCTTESEQMPNTSWQPPMSGLTPWETQVAFSGMLMPMGANPMMRQFTLSPILEEHHEMQDGNLWKLLVQDPEWSYWVGPQPASFATPACCACRHTSLHTWSATMPDQFESFWHARRWHTWMSWWIILDHSTMGLIKRTAGRLWLQKRSVMNKPKWCIRRPR